MTTPAFKIIFSLTKTRKTAELDEPKLSSIPDILQTYKGEISQLIAE